MALIEAILSKENHLIKQGIGDAASHAPLAGTIDKQMTMLLHLGHLLFTHGPPQQVGLTERVAGQVLGDPHDLLLIHHDPIGFLKDRL